MKKDLLIQKMVKIAKTQQFLLKKIAGLDHLKRENIDMDSLPGSMSPDMPNDKQFYLNAYKSTIKELYKLERQLNNHSISSSEYDTNVMKLELKLNKLEKFLYEEFDYEGPTPEDDDYYHYKNQDLQYF